MQKVIDEILHEKLRKKETLSSEEISYLLTYSSSNNKQLLYSSYQLSTDQYMKVLQIEHDLPSLLIIFRKIYKNKLYKDILSRHKKKEIRLLSLLSIKMRKEDFSSIYNSLGRPYIKSKYNLLSFAVYNLKLSPKGEEILLSFAKPSIIYPYNFSCNKINKLIYKKRFSSFYSTESIEYIYYAFLGARNNFKSLDSNLVNYIIDIDTSEIKKIIPLILDNSSHFGDNYLNYLQFINIDELRNIKIFIKPHTIKIIEKYPRFYPILLELPPHELPYDLLSKIAIFILEERSKEGLNTFSKILEYHKLPEDNFFFNFIKEFYFEKRLLRIISENKKLLLDNALYLPIDISLSSYWGREDVLSYLLINYKGEDYQTLSLFLRDFDGCLVDLLSIVNNLGSDR